MAKAVYKAIIFSIPAKGASTKASRVGFYRLLHAVAFRYYDLWLLSSLASNDVVRKLLEKAGAIPGAFAMAVEVCLDPTELKKYLEKRLAELEKEQEKSPVSYRQDEIRIIKHEIEKLALLEKTEGSPQIN